MFSICVAQESSQTSTTLDIQELRNDSHAEIPLDRNWTFYWNELITPETIPANSGTVVSLDNWTNYELAPNEKLPSFGYATYRLQFSLPKERPVVSLLIPAGFAASKIWLNGNLVAEIGTVGTSKATTLHRRATRIVPLDIHETNFELIIQVANFYHHKGGISTPVILATNEHLLHSKTKKTIADMIFIGSLGFIGLFFLLFFSFYWNKDRAVLYFGIMCVSLAYMAISDRYAPLAEVFSTISWSLLTVVEYISLFLAGFSASLFFYTIFSKFANPIYLKALKIGFWTLTALVIILPAPHFTRLVIPFLILMIINLMYVFYVIYKAITSKRHDSILLLLGVLFASFIFFTHIFIFLGTDGNTIVYVNFGYIIVFLLLSMLLMTRFATSFHALEKAKIMAQKQKEELSVKSKELSMVNVELKENLNHLEKINAELDSFNHIVSHDLKAPLIAINTLVSFIEEDIDETVLDEDTKDRFQLLKDRVSKMYALINDLLQYSKITKGEKTKETFLLNDLLDEVVEIVDNEKKHTIKLPEDNAEIFASKVELEHVFQNLISNAIKHNDKQSAVIAISFAKTEHEYTFIIADNGPGIEPKYHTKIFEMFSKLEANDEVESTGIGLSIVKKIVTENYGTIRVDSEKGVGTTITFTWKA
ncbi:sensor histidine kinase [Kordia jejudonensis]|uniref:sensor histidine kinase n=1 Tax=Kordia jejudonensis TaxID=1348245 RepID=UPI00069C2CAA|nr:ATP-binding protein [Kordia jejudonensis]